MIIERELKRVNFIWDTEERALKISEFFVDPMVQGGAREMVKLTRIEMFSLARFIIRVVQKPVKRKVKKNGNV